MAHERRTGRRRLDDSPRGGKIAAQDAKRILRLDWPLDRRDHPRVGQFLTREVVANAAARDRERIEVDPPAHRAHDRRDTAGPEKLFN